MEGVKEFGCFFDECLFHIGSLPQEFVLSSLVNDFFSADEDYITSDKLFAVCGKFDFDTVTLSNTGSTNHRSGSFCVRMSVKTKTNRLSKDV